MPRKKKKKEEETIVQPTTQPTVRIEGRQVFGEEAQRLTTEAREAREGIPAIPGATRERRRGPEGEVEFEQLQIPGQQPITTVAPPVQPQAPIPLSNLQKQFYAEGGFTPLDEDLPQIRAVQALGIGVALVGAAVIGVMAAPLAGTAAIAVGAAVGGGLGVASIISGTSVSDVVNKVLGRETAQDLQSSINTIGQMASTIVGTQQAGGIDRGKAIAELKQLDDMLLIVEHKIQKSSILDPSVKISGQYVDILTDIADQRTTIREGAADVISTVPTYDPVSIQAYTKQFEDIGIAKRKQLIEQGILKETL